MAGRRPLTHSEERALIRVARKSEPRVRALLTTQLFTGLRAFEVALLTVGQVWRNGQVVTQIGVPPRNRKGGYGGTHWVPVSPELNRALQHYLARRTAAAGGKLEASAPLFPSRKHTAEGALRPISRKQVYRLVLHAFALANIEDDGRLGTHTMRKSFASKVFKNSGCNLLLTRDALGHQSARTTEMYVEVRGADVHRAILRSDWTRRPRRPAGTTGLPV